MWFHVVVVRRIKLHFFVSVLSVDPMISAANFGSILPLANSSISAVVKEVFILLRDSSESYMKINFTLIKSV